MQNDPDSTVYSVFQVGCPEEIKNGNFATAEWTYTWDEYNSSGVLVYKQGLLP